jgi:integrase
VIRKLRNASRVGGGLTFHGLRTTAATMLAEAGCDTRTIGHKAEAMVRLNIEEAEKKERAAAAIAKLDFARKQSARGTYREQKCLSLPRRDVYPSR